MSWKAESFQDGNYRSVGRYGEKNCKKMLKKKNKTLFCFPLPPTPPYIIYFSKIDLLYENAKNESGPIQIFGPPSHSKRQVI